MKVMEVENIVEIIDENPHLIREAFSIQESDFIKAVMEEIVSLYGYEDREENKEVSIKIERR